jgi:hypothetical protein
MVRSRIGYDSAEQLNFPGTANGAYTLLDSRLLIEERAEVGSVSSASGGATTSSAHRYVTRAITALPSTQGEERIQAAREHFQEHWVSEEAD